MIIFPSRRPLLFLLGWLLMVPVTKGQDLMVTLGINESQYFIVEPSENQEATWSSKTGYFAGIEVQRIPLVENVWYVGGRVFYERTRAETSQTLPGWWDSQILVIGTIQRSAVGGVVYPVQLSLFNDRAVFSAGAEYSLTVASNPEGNYLQRDVTVSYFDQPIYAIGKDAISDHRLAANGSIGYRKLVGKLALQFSYSFSYGLNDQFTPDMEFDRSGNHVHCIGLSVGLSK